jgi:hypothetical protein
VSFVDQFLQGVGPFQGLFDQEEVLHNEPGNTSQQDWSWSSGSEGLPYPRLKQEVCGWYTSHNTRCAGFKEFAE